MLDKLEAIKERFEEVSPEARKAANVTNLPFFAVFKNGTLLDTIAASKEEAVLNLINKLN